MFPIKLLGKNGKIIVSITNEDDLQMAFGLLGTICNLRSMPPDKRTMAQRAATSGSADAPMLEAPSKEKRTIGFKS